MKPNSDISWLTYNNIAGVVASALMIAAAFWGVSTRVSVLETKMDNMNEKMDGLIAQQTRVLDNLNDLNRRLVALETMHLK